MLFTACATLSRPSGPAITGEAGSAEGQWRGRALIRDKRAGKSSELELEIVAREPSRLRIEAVSGGLGVHLASFVLIGDEARALLSRERRFIKSHADADSLRALVPVRLSPQSLMNLLFDRPLSSKEWRCETATGGVVSRCTQLVASEGEALVVVFKSSTPEKRRFEIASPRATIDLILEPNSPKVEVGPELFKLDPPSGYSIENR